MVAEQYRGQLPADSPNIAAKASPAVGLGLK
jgi:hypothetical protein